MRLKLRRWCLIMTVYGALGCGDDPTRRLTSSVEAYCELDEQCNELPAQHSKQDCEEGQWTILAGFHSVFGAGCIDAVLDQLACRLGYDCILSPQLLCPDGEVSCEQVYPCQELVEPAERACGGFASTPDMGIGPPATGGTGGLGGTTGPGGSGGTSGTGGSR